MLLVGPIDADEGSDTGDVGSGLVHDGRSLV